MKKIFKNKICLAVLIFFVITVVLICVNIVRAQLVKSGEGTETIQEATSSGLSYNGVYDVPYSPTNYQEELYKQLSEEIKDYQYDENNRDIDKEIAICNMVLDNWVADFYTWSNKNSSYDVGGMQFIYHEASVIYDQARDTYYNNLDGYIAQYGRENLPQVSNIHTSGAVFGGDGFELWGEKVISYYGEAHWDYADCAVDTSNFPHDVAAHFIADAETGSWRIVRIYKIN